MACHPTESHSQSLRNTLQVTLAGFANSSLDLCHSLVSPIYSYRSFLTSVQVPSHQRLTYGAWSLYIHVYVVYIDRANI